MTSIVRIQSRPQLVKALLPYAKPDTLQGVLRFAADYALFLAGTAVALLATNLALRVAGGFLAGWRMSTLYAIAHDAAHNTLTASKRLNKVIGAISYMTGFYNYRLRLYDHLLRHHPMVNGPQPDAYRPLSLAQYEAMPAWRRAWERFIRSGNPLSWMAYGAVMRMLKSETFPKKTMPANVRRGAWGFAAVLGVYVSVLLAAIAYASVHAGAFSIAQFAVNLFFTLVVPFLVFQANMGFTVYFQHTDPRVPWFGEGDARHVEHGSEELSVHVDMPRWVSSLFHHAFCHAAHHVCPSIPCYRLYDAQRELAARMGEASVTVPFRLRTLIDVAARCKLYDYEHHHWIDFDGRPTSPRLVSYPQAANRSKFGDLMEIAA
ncbi:MAG TPA: fatty acid desaturase [Ramlibacter sp.]|uniref:fatty acid desaturase family protein n=1 Tax=Ramlibacter sp. TaxID=1917967 RepID=UPI002D0BA127|nr:fatty acid desaturase [Ramlibacter sp.]HVZ42560.1 fatty acid desaturase [Ramlibacter sp.]